MEKTLLIYAILFYVSKGGMFIVAVIIFLRISGEYILENVTKMILEGTKNFKIMASLLLLDQLENPPKTLEKHSQLLI